MVGLFLFVPKTYLFLGYELKQKNILILRAQKRHLTAIDNIYNQAIADSLRTAHLEPLTKKQRQDWFRIHTRDEYPVFVWLEGTDVMGWLSISPYRSGREALAEMAEISYYVHYNHHGKSIGSNLVEHGIAFSKKQGFRILVAIMVSGNEASRILAEKFGFEESGRIKNALRFKDEIRDHVYMSLELS